MSIFDRFNLTGKCLFITGGSRGLGREMALAIADAGADVILVGRDPASLEKTASDIRALGCQSWTITADVGKPAALVRRTTSDKTRSCCGPKRRSNLGKRTCARSLLCGYSAQHAKSDNELAQFHVLRALLERSQLDREPDRGRPERFFHAS